MHIVSTNDGLITTQGKPVFKNQEFFGQDDTGSHHKGTVVTLVCFVLKLVMLLLCTVFVRFLVHNR